MRNPETEKLDAFNYKLSQEYFDEKKKNRKNPCVVMITWGQRLGVT